MKRCWGQFLLAAFCLFLAFEAVNANGYTPSGAGDVRTFEFVDTPLRDAFRLIGRAFNVGIAMDDNVKADKITLTLPNYTCEQALDFLARLKGLKFMKYNNVYIVGAEETMAKNFDLQTTRIFHLNYIAAKDLAAATEVLGLFGKDNIKADEKANILVVKGFELQLQNLEEIIRQLDIEVPVVMFDVRIEELSSSASQMLGLAGAGTFTLSNIDLGPNWRGSLEAMEQKGEAVVRARPSIAILNGQKGETGVFTQYPIITGVSEDENGNMTYSYTYVDVGIKISITPQVNNLGEITVIFKGELSTLGSYSLGVMKSIEKRNVDSIFRINDGESYLFSGMLWDSMHEDIKGIPIISSLPLLGKLFQHKEQTKETKELIFLITARIFKGKLSPEDRLNLKNSGITTTSVDVVIPLDKPEEATITKSEQLRRLEELLKKSGEDLEAGGGAGEDAGETLKPEGGIPTAGPSVGPGSPAPIPTPTPEQGAQSPPPPPGTQQPQPGGETPGIPQAEPEGQGNIEKRPDGSRIVQYVVKRKDTYYSISKKYGIKVDDILKENNLTASNILEVGQVLRIPVPADHIYKIKRGDTLYSLAKKFNTTVAVLMEINNITDPAKIEVNQEIIVPGPVKQ
ncbi:MAG: LysM peptidoglycan-binding domain-containing protein [Bacillota bacterium]